MIKMIKSEALEKLREKGAADALELRSAAAAGSLSQTEIIARESAVPAWDAARDYTNVPAGSPVADGGQVWLLLQPHNAANYSGRPAELRALWGLAHTKDPANAKPYVAPYGTSGLYLLGECCIRDGVVYRSVIDNNSWLPEEYPDGWEAVT